MTSTKQKNMSTVMNHIDELDTIIIHQKRVTKDTKSVNYKVIRSKEGDTDTISVAYVEEKTVNKEDSTTKQEKEDLFIYLKDDHEGMLLEVRLTELSCQRRILKVESPNGVKLGYVKKGRFSGYEICNPNHISLFRFKMKSRNNEYKAEVTDTKTGKLTAIFTQSEVEPDTQSFEIKYISKPPVLQKILILSAVISELLPRTATDFCYTCFLIPKFTFVVILYIMIGLFSIVLYVALFIDALLFIAFVILVVLKGRAKKGDDFFANWGKCMEITFYTPFKIYKTLNKFFGVNICQ
ncbi:uncharacterized protein LOC143074368 [Mytilus galloprovincialis]|uniref:uncharacterized protein LOC143074368 n=1 Tax=Mytilus galloprovincialis TaxID=29158 RepID=UPI003F7CAA5A